MALENIRKHIILDVSKNRYVVVVIKQYDKDTREIIVKVTDDGKPYPINNTIVPRFKCQKTDGTKIYNDCTIFDNGDVKIDITEQLTAIAGMHDCELVLYDASSDEVLHTMSFIVNVKDSVFPDDEVVSSDEFNALQNALLKVDTFNADVVLNSANEYTDNAIADLINGAPTTLDTLKEIADAMAENETVVDALEQAIGTKANASDFTNVDNTSDMDKPISTAQQSALDLKEDIVNVIGENLIPYPYYHNTQTQNGMTFTDMGDGTIKISNTSTAACFFVFRARIETDKALWLKKGTYTLSGGSNNAILQLYSVEGTTTKDKLAESKGDSATFTLTEDTKIQVQLYVPSGVNGNNEIVKPMLECGSHTHEYQPYNISRQGIIEQIPVDNLLIYPYVQTTRTHNSITYTDLGNGQIRVTGTPSDSTNFKCRSRLSTDDNNQLTLPKGIYTVSGCPGGGSLTTYYLQAGYTGDNGSWASLGNDYGDGVTFTLTKDTAIQLLIVVDNDCPNIDVTFKPMIEVGTIPHTWQPYNHSRKGITKQIVVDNLLEYPYYERTKTTNDITFTVNDADGTVTANGTANANASFIFTHRIDNKVILPKGTYTVSGCPSGGGSNSYYLQIAKTKDNSFYLIGSDTGNGFTFTLTEDTDILIAIYIASGATVTNLVFKPMLEIGTVAHPYQPYTLSRKGLVEQITVDNLLSYPYHETTHTQYEITWTDNGDGTVKANGTNTDTSKTSQFYFNSDTTLGLKPNTTYTLSGCPSGGSASTYAMRIIINYQKEGQTYYRDIGNGVTFTTPSNYIHCRIMVDVASGVTVNNLTFKPMLEKGSVIHPYTEYKLSRQKLREDIDSIGSGGSDVTVTPALTSGTKVGTITVDGTSKDLYAPNSVATTSANGLMTKEDKTKLNMTNIAYGTCSTDAATSAKVVTIDGNDNWSLQKGSIIVVKFTNTSTASNVTINVNNTGAKQVWYNTGVYTGNSNLVGGAANRFTTFIYDGTYWVWIGQSQDANTSTNAAFGQGYGTCGTAETTAAKVVTLSNYVLALGGIVSVKFTYAVPANATMNINSRGAKNIFYRGSAITANVIKAGDIATFIYDGTQYHVISVDRGINNMLTTSDVVDNVTSTSTTLPLSANQGTTLNGRIDDLQPHGYSLIRHTDIGALTTTEKTYTLFNSRKMSDYGMLLITIGASNSDIRATMTVPVAIFSGVNIANSQTLYLDCWSNNGNTFNQVCIKYVSDTQIKANIVTSSTVAKYLNIYGIKIDDKPI